MDEKIIRYRQFFKKLDGGYFIGHWGFIDGVFARPQVIKGSSGGTYPESFQFTGLYDNTMWKQLTEDEQSQWTLDGNMPSEWKGKEIWEGSILKYDDKDFPETVPDIGVVEWCEGWIVKGEGSYAPDSLQDFLHGNHVTVIGDMTENPKLMEMKK